MSPLLGVIVVLMVVVTATISAEVSRRVVPRVKIFFLSCRLFLKSLASKSENTKKTERVEIPTV